MSDLFRRFAPILLSVTEQEVRTDPTLNQRLLLGTAPPLSIFYAPFDHIQTSAKIVIVGITPGLQQATNALLEAKRQLESRKPLHEALAAAKVFASFSGPMRANLITMLDFIGLNRWAKLSSAASLWAENSDLVHFTSALRYPVLLSGKNYSGSPSMSATPILRQFIERYLKEEADALSEAVWVPLGPAANVGVSHLVASGAIKPDRVLAGLPHPSGANAERIAYFVGRKQKEALSTKTNAALLDEIRDRLTKQVAAL